MVSPVTGNGTRDNPWVIEDPTDYDDVAQSWITNPPGSDGIFVKWFEFTVPSDRSGTWRLQTTLTSIGTPATPPPTQQDSDILQGTYIREHRTNATYDFSAFGSPNINTSTSFSAGENVTFAIKYYRGYISATYGYYDEGGLETYLVGQGYNPSNATITLTAPDPPAVDPVDLPVEDEDDPEPPQTDEDTTGESSTNPTVINNPLGYVNVLQNWANADITDSSDTDIMTHYFEFDVPSNSGGTWQLSVSLYPPNVDIPSDITTSNLQFGIRNGFGNVADTTVSPTGDAQNITRNVSFSAGDTVDFALRYRPAIIQSGTAYTQSGQQRYTYNGFLRVTLSLLPPSITTINTYGKISTPSLTMNSYGDLLDKEIKAPDNRVFVLEANPFLIMNSFYTGETGKPDTLLDIPYNPFINERLYFSDVGFTTGSSDTPANKNMAARLISGYEFGASINEPEAVFQNPRRSFGEIRLNNADGKLSDLLNLAWQGSEVIIKCGEIGNDYTDFETVFIGTVKDFSWDQSSISITLRDLQENLNKDIQENLYSGDSALEGDETIQDNPKPLVFGYCAQIKPVLVDKAQLVYQVHDGPVAAIHNVYDNGVRLTFNKDVGDILQNDTSLTSNPGRYNTSLANGYFKLGARPSGIITADVKGQINTSIPQIIRHIAVNHAGLKDPGNIVRSQFNLLNSKYRVYGAGIYITSKANIASVFNSLITGINSFWCFTRSGLLCIGEYNDPLLNEANKQINDTNIEHNRITGKSALSPVWRYKIFYGRRWEVLDEEKSAGSLSIDEKTSLSKEYSVVAVDDASVKTAWPLAQDIEIPTLLTGAYDAEQIAKRRLDRDKVGRRIYVINVLNGLFAFDIGDIVNIQSKDYDLLNGKHFFVLGFREESDTGISEVSLYG